MDNLSSSDMNRRTFLRKFAAAGFGSFVSLFGSNNDVLPNSIQYNSVEREKENYEIYRTRNTRADMSVIIVLSELDEGTFKKCLEGIKSLFSLRGFNSIVLRSEIIKDASGRGGSISSTEENKNLNFGQNQDMVLNRYLPGKASEIAQIKANWLLLENGLETAINKQDYRGYINLLEKEHRKIMDMLIEQDDLISPEFKSDVRWAVSHWKQRRLLAYKSGAKTITEVGEVGADLTNRVKDVEIQIENKIQKLDKKIQEGTIMGSVPQVLVKEVGLWKEIQTYLHKRGLITYKADVEKFKTDIRAIFLNYEGETHDTLRLNTGAREFIEDCVNYCFYIRGVMY